MGFVARRTTGLVLLVGIGLGVVLLTALVTCERRAVPVIDTALTFDGQARTISTNEVSCTRLPNGSLVILVDGGREQSIRAVVHTRGRLVVERIGLRHKELSGFVADPAEVDVIKVDETYTFRGLLPPNPGETRPHRFETTVTCPRYQTPPPPSPHFRPPPLN